MTAEDVAAAHCLSWARTVRMLGHRLPGELGEGRQVSWARTVRMLGLPGELGEDVGT